MQGLAVVLRARRCAWFWHKGFTPPPHCRILHWYAFYSKNIALICVALHCKIFHFTRRVRFSCNLNWNAVHRILLQSNWEDFPLSCSFLGTRSPLAHLPCIRPPPTHPPPLQKLHTHCTQCTQCTHCTQCTDCTDCKHCTDICKLALSPHIFANFPKYMKTCTNYCKFVKMFAKFPIYLKSYTHNCKLLKMFANFHRYLKTYTYNCKLEKMFANFHRYLKTCTHNCKLAKMFASFPLMCKFAHIIVILQRWLQTFTDICKLAHIIVNSQRC